MLNINVLIFIYVNVILLFNEKRKKFSHHRCINLYSLIYIYFQLIFYISLYIINYIHIVIFYLLS